MHCCLRGCQHGDPPPPFRLQRLGQPQYFTGWELTCCETVSGLCRGTALFLSLKTCLHCNSDVLYTYFVHVPGKGKWCADSFLQCGRNYIMSMYLEYVDRYMETLILYFGRKISIGSYTSTGLSCCCHLESSWPRGTPTTLPSSTCETLCGLEAVRYKLGLHCAPPAFHISKLIHGARVVVCRGHFVEGRVCLVHLRTPAVQSQRRQQDGGSKLRRAKIWPN